MHLKKKLVKLPRSPTLICTYLEIRQSSIKLAGLLGLRECVRILDLRVQVHPGELWVSKQRVHTVPEASKTAGAKGDV